MASARSSPTTDKLNEAYETFVKSDRLSEAFDDLKEKLEGEDEETVRVPDDLKIKIEKLLKEKPDITWHRAIRLIVDPDAPEHEDDDDDDDGEQHEDDEDLSEIDE